MIDTLKYTRELEKAGFNSEQAEIVVRAQIDMITSSVTTKADLLVLESRMDAEFIEVRSHLKEINLRLDNMDRRFEEIDRRFEEVDRRFEEIDRRFDLLEHKFEEVDRRFEDIDRRFEGVHSKMDSLENRITFKIVGAMVLLLTLSGLINKLF
ncbi:MAG: coiled-coil domain-containing protein [Bdellovibrionota bacterium]|nr:coiled-coil domain-containing protein [Bdellovibrionota bacterium]